MPQGFPLCESILYVSLDLFFKPAEGGYNLIYACVGMT